MVRKVNPHPNKTIFNASEACGYCGLSWNKLKSLIREGFIASSRVGVRYLITKDSIDRYVNRDEIANKVFIRENT